MKVITASFLQRLKMIDLLEQQEGPLGKTAPFLRVLDKLRWTEAEHSTVKVSQVDAQTIRYEAPSDFKVIEVELEDKDCKVVAEMLNEHPKFTVADHRWADPLLAQLKA